jgi:3-phosphoshikimate 1-carboxyvinyltransferase
MGVSVTTEGGVVVVEGGSLGRHPATVNARLAGTTSRFLTALGALRESPLTITGEAALRVRPMTPLHDALESLGFVVERQLGGHGLPVTVSRPVEGTIGERVRLPGDVSSQFVSALMMIAPILPNGLIIELDGPKVSESYIQMTASIMSAFGVPVSMTGSLVEVKHGAYRAGQFAVEPDFSSAAFPIAAAVIAGGCVRVPGLASASLQGDSRILDIAVSMGATVEVDGNDVVVSRSADVEVAAIDIDMSDCSDLVPAVAMMCACASGTSTLNGIGFIRHKESDRLGDLATEMREIEARVDVLADGLVIHGVDSLVAGRCNTHHDHRLAMALSLGALTAQYVDVCDSDVVSKSWPSYWESMSDIISSATTTS